MDAATLLRSARVRRGLSQSQVATRAGTSQPVISAYERGHRDPTTETLRRLVAATGERLDLGLTAETSAVPPPRDLAEHAARLVDVLLLADAIPHAVRPAGPMPRMVSRS
jgi:transcriptional regulator with XRE-family HTH domain